MQNSALGDSILVSIKIFEKSFFGVLCGTYNGSKRSSAGGMWPVVHSVGSTWSHCKVLFRCKKGGQPHRWTRSAEGESLAGAEAGKKDTNIRSKLLRGQDAWKRDIGEEGHNKLPIRLFNEWCKQSSSGDYKKSHNRV